MFWLHKYQPPKPPEPASFEWMKNAIKREESMPNEPAEPDIYAELEDLLERAHAMPRGRSLDTLKLRIRIILGPWRHELKTLRAALAQPNP